MVPVGQMRTSGTAAVGAGQPPTGWGPPTGWAGQPPTGVASARTPIRAVTASAASGPAARTVICWPRVAPRPMTASTLLASAVFVPAVSSTTAWNLAAITARDPAGRACRSPVSVIAASQLPGMTRLLGRLQHRLDVAASRGGDRGRDRALDERGIRQGDGPGEILLGEQRPDRQHRAAEVGQDHHAGTGARALHRPADPRDTGPDAAVVRATRRGDDDAPAADLPGHLGRALGQRGTVRDENDANPCFVAHALS